MVGRSLPGPVGYAQIPALAERGLQRLQRVFIALGQHLQGCDFVAGGQFSVADITAVVAVDFARVVKLSPGEQHPRLPHGRHSGWWNRAAMQLRCRQSDVMRPHPASTRAACTGTPNSR